MASKFGNTWWGEQWLGALKNIDYSNRLPRGASYARGGKVREINIQKNVISAKVQGSRRTPYRETIILPEFSSKNVDKLIGMIKQQPVVLSKLFNREMDPMLVGMAEKAGIALFPKKWSDLRMQCSCPDWAVPCKHLAAVIYKVCMEIDNNPFLVFSLHGVDLMEELEKRGIVSLSSRQTMEVENISNVWGSDTSGVLAEAAQQIPNYTTLQNLTQSFCSLLMPAAFSSNGDFRAMYGKELQYIASKAQKILFNKLKISDNTFQNADPLQPISLEDATPDRLQKLLDMEEEQMHKCHPTWNALRCTLICLLQIVAHGCITPQIYFEETTQKKRGRAKSNVEKQYLIVWQPALIDKATKDIVSELGQSPQILSRLLTDIIALLSHDFTENMLMGLFFNKRHYGFKQIGEENMPGGIRSWLDRFFMHNLHKVSFLINETEQGFSLSLTIDGNTLQDIMTKKKFQETKLEILRQLSILCDFVTGLENYINSGGEDRIEFTLKNFSDFLFNVSPAMRLLGVSIIMPKALEKLIRPKVSLKIRTRSEDKPSTLSISNLLEFEWQVALGDTFISTKEFNELLKGASGLLRFRGQYLYIDPAQVVKLAKVLSSPPKMKPGELLQVALSEQYNGARVELSKEVRSVMEKFTSQSEIPLPKGLQAELRPYQKRGFEWMYRNLKLGFGSIIADDMGLGKTLQVITLLMKIEQEGELKKKKALVVVPAGLLYNWQEEIRRFAPALSSGIYHGLGRSLEADTCKDAKIILTTYGVIRSDEELIKKQKWQIVVIDEAQNIKNSTTQQSKALRSIPSQSFIAMSGTPVENSLSEFWSIIDFTNRGYLGSLQDFRENFAQPIQKCGDKHAAELFRKVTAPFLLRRLKTDKTIINDLPDKIERDEFSNLTPEQAALYEKTLQSCMKIIEGLEGDDSQTLFKRQGLILQMILALKQICNHPTQYLKDKRMDASISGKTVMLLDLLRSILDANEKVLIFTQFREMGDLLVEFIKENLGEHAMFYHGGCTLSQRKDMVNLFQNNPSQRIFILTLKAAGTGLNLTAATHVIHYDLWWNPAVEAQATDRAYRIGQHSNVQVHRFLTLGTFEERINEMIQQKKELAKLTVSTGENWIGKLSNNELREIFQYEEA
ncbi:MAG: DEAD/DEAH box helicase [Alistipes sp.]|nr:DEAD/DEAH box helicase [Candidatus Alistipes equi]